MKPIKNFTNHPSLEYEPIQFIFAMRKPHNESELYLLTEDKGVRKIFPAFAQSTTLGTPSPRLARFCFHYPSYYNLREKGEEDSIDIDLKDLPNLIIMLMGIGIDLPLDKELQKYIDND